MLACLTWPEAGRRSEAVLVIPLGSTEQHGPHLPLSTDADIATALALRLTGDQYEAVDVVVAPTLPYGASGEHAGFAGTLSIGQEALERVVVELVRSATATFRRVLLLSAHGGNAEPLARAVHRLVLEGRDVRLWSPGWRGDAHAGRTETSVQLALDAGRVRADLAEAGATGPLAALLPALRSGGVRAVSPNGVLGDPAGARAEAGEALLSAATQDLVALVQRW